jgi:two-component system cell cycle response regulator
LGLGIAALVLDLPALGLLAGICAIVAVFVARQPGAPEVHELDENKLEGEPEPEPVPARRRTDAEGATEAAVEVATEPLAVVEPSEIVDPDPEGADVAHLPTDATRKVEKAMTSPITDPTGLFSEDYFKIAVETRVSAARRHLRPVAIVLFDVVQGVRSGAPTRVAPEPVVQAIRTTLREADTACRLADGRFGFVLEDTPEDGAIWTVERLRRALTDANQSERDAVQTRWAGIACYPAHAFSASETLAKAQAAFEAAKDWPQDRIEVATASD